VNESEVQASFVLILNRAGNAVNSYPAIPVPAALLLNMALSGASDLNKAEADLTTRYPNLARQWIDHHFSGLKLN
jgi:hypothetical protein